MKFDGYDLEQSAICIATQQRLGQRPRYFLVTLFCVQIEQYIQSLYMIIINNLILIIMSVEIDLTSNNRLVVPCIARRRKIEALKNVLSFASKAVSSNPI